MKRTYSLLVFLLLGVLSWSQDDITLEEHNLFGRVKQIETYQIDYKEVFGKAQESEKRLFEVMKFNSVGMIVQQDNEEVSTEYKYNDSGEVVEKIRNTKSKLLQELSEKYEYNVYEKSIYNYTGANTYETYIYDKQNNLLMIKKVEIPNKKEIIIRHFDNTGIQTLKQVYILNSNASIVRLEAIDKSGTVTHLKVSTYDAQNNCIMDEMTMKDGTIHMLHTYAYNEKGILSSKIQKNRLGEIELDYEYKYDYKYDVQGNWIEKNTYLITTEFGEIRKVLESKQSRIIEYY